MLFSGKYSILKNSVHIKKESVTLKTSVKQISNCYSNICTTVALKFMMTCNNMCYVFLINCVLSKAHEGRKRHLTKVILCQKFSCFHGDVDSDCDLSDDRV